MPKYYVLDEDNNPVEAADHYEWVKFFRSGNRQTAEDFVRNARVSTVFLGLDHNYSGEGPPLLFETMIFGGKLDGGQWRYSTREEALAGHIETVRRVLLEDR